MTTDQLLVKGAARVCALRTSYSELEVTDDEDQA